MNPSVHRGILNDIHRRISEREREIARLREVAIYHEEFLKPESGIQANGTAIPMAGQIPQTRTLSRTEQIKQALEAHNNQATISDICRYIKEHFGMRNIRTGRSHSMHSLEKSIYRTLQGTPTFISSGNEWIST